jgi:hypothetical protein
MTEVETEGFAREARTWICHEGPENSHGRRLGSAGNRSDGAEVINHTAKTNTDIWNQNYHDTQNHHKQKKTALVLFEQDPSKPLVLYKGENQDL